MAEQRKSAQRQKNVGSRSSRSRSTVLQEALQRVSQTLPADDSAAAQSVSRTSTAATDLPVTTVEAIPRRRTVSLQNGDVARRVPSPTHLPERSSAALPQVHTRMSISTPGDDSDDEGATLEELRRQARLRAADFLEQNRSLEYWKLIRKQLVVKRWAKPREIKETLEQQVKRRQKGQQTDKDRRFLAAVRDNDVAAMNKAINSGADPNVFTEDGGNAVHVAVQGNAMDTLKALLQREDVDNSVPDERLITPLQSAVMLGNRPMVYELIMAGVHLYVEDNFGRTPLHTAALRGKVNIVKLLLYYGAEPNAPDCFGTTPLSIAVLTNPFPDIARSLLSAGGRIDVCSTTGIHVLSEAVLCCTSETRLDAIRVLVSHGASVNVKDMVSGQTPLHYAAITNNAHVTVVLLKAGADPNILNASGQTALETALIHRGHSVVEVLRAYLEGPEDNEGALEATAKHGSAAGHVLELLAEVRALAMRRGSLLKAHAVDMSEPSTPDRLSSSHNLRSSRRSYRVTAMTVPTTPSTISPTSSLDSME